MSYANQPQTALRCPASALLAAVLMLVLLGACSDTTADVSLAALVEQQAEYNGQTLSATGTVRTFDEPRHYWIEDDDLNRVAIEPDEAVSDFVGKRVQVTGDYRADRETGRILEATEVIVLDSGPE